MKETVAMIILMLCSGMFAYWLYAVADPSPSYEDIKFESAETQVVVKNLLSWWKETWIEYFNSLKWATYKLWAKDPSWWSIDCSWLIGYYLHKQWKMSMKDVIFRMNAKNLFDKYNTNDTRFPAQPWDMAFFHSLDWDTNHIWIVRSVTTHSTWHKLTLRDSSYPQNWLSERTIYVEYTWWINLYCNQWYCYNIFYKKFLNDNELWLQKTSQKVLASISSVAKADYINDDVYYFTPYNLNPSQTDNTPCIWAAWYDQCKMWDEWTRSMALTKDIRKKYWVKWWDEVLLEWDKWCRWRYVIADEMNCRFRWEYAHENKTCYKKDWTKADGNVYRPWTQVLIKWDLVNRPWWVCYIKEIYKN